MLIARTAHSGSILNLRMEVIMGRTTAEVHETHEVYLDDVRTVQIMSRSMAA